MKLRAKTKKNKMFENLKKYQFFRLPKLALLFAFCAFAMGMIVVQPLSQTWASRQDYSFGYLMPIFALYVLYDRWGKIFGYFQTPSPQGVVYGFKEKLATAFFGLMFVCAVLVFLMGTFFYAMTGNFGAPAFIMTFGFSFAVFSMAFFASQRDAFGNLKPMKARLAFTMLFLFSSFAWLISAPMFSIMEKKTSLFLLSHVANFVYHIMDVLGYVVTLKGNVLEFPKGPVGVADACSGIRSLTACLFAGTFLAAVFLDKFWKKVLMVLLSMFFAFFNNLLRALFLSFYAYEHGSESISGTVHDLAGYFVMGMTIVCLLLLLPLFQLSAVPKEFREENLVAEDSASDDKNEQG